LIWSGLSALPATHSTTAANREQSSTLTGQREIFSPLALFLARAVVRSERSEKDVVHRLREIGFSAAEPMNQPNFPVDNLTALAVALFLYLILAGWLFSDAAGMTREPIDGLLMAVKITLVRLATIGVTVWLMQRYAFFRRMPGDPPRCFAYLLNGCIAAAVAFAICLPFDMTKSGNALPPTLLSFALCTAVALCCDDWVEDTPPPAWLRFAEAAGCSTVMVASVLLLYFGNMLTFPAGALTPNSVALLIALPTGLASVIGAYVPHIYRSARRSAMARRDEAKLFSLSAQAHVGSDERVKSEGPRHHTGRLLAELWPRSVPKSDDQPVRPDHHRNWRRLV
jgi:ABC-type amino acid transport system permease subunit